VDSETVEIGGSVWGYNRHTLCTQRSVNGRELKSSSSAILKQFTLVRGENVGVVAVVSREGSVEEPACVSLLTSFWTDEHFLKERILIEEETSTQRNT
jgi:hypothetical protein